MDAYRNKEGYPDPTAGEALARIQRQEQGYRPLVYICSPYSGDELGNTEKAKSYCRFAVDKGAIPFAPHLLFPLFMKEETERELALFMGQVILSRCDEIWVFGETLSSGMRDEIEKAKRKRMTIRCFDCATKEEARA